MRGNAKLQTGSASSAEPRNGAWSPREVAWGPNWQCGAWSHGEELREVAKGPSNGRQSRGGAGSDPGVWGPTWPVDRPCTSHPTRHSKRLSTPATAHSYSAGSAALSRHSESDDLSCMAQALLLSKLQSQEVSELDSPKWLTQHEHDF